MSRLFEKPARLFVAALRPILLRSNEREFRPMFEAGERLIAFDLTKEGFLWGASNRAMYSMPTPARQDGRTSHGSVVRSRIPYERIISVDEQPDGSDLRRVVRCFPLNGGLKISGTGGDLTPFTKVVNDHIERLVTDRKTLKFQGRYVKFVCRKVEPDHRLDWLVEGYETGLDPATSSFASWLETTLKLLNSDR